MKDLYEVRVREQVGPMKWQKKSKFYYAAKPKEARGKYDGPGKVMWVQKSGREKLLGIGEFFTMGNRLLKEFAAEGTKSPLLQQHEAMKEKGRRKRFALLKERRLSV